MSKRGVKLYLEDIKEAIRKIEKYTKDISFAEFSGNEQIIDAVVRNLSVIGEAVINLPEEIKANNPEVAWNEIKGMRNKVVHEYFGIDEEILIYNIKDNFKKIYQADAPGNWPAKISWSDDGKNLIYDRQIIDLNYLN